MMYRCYDVLPVNHPKKRISTQLPVIPKSLGKEGELRQLNLHKGESYAVSFGGDQTEEESGELSTSSLDPNVSSASDMRRVLNQS